MSAVDRLRRRLDRLLATDRFRAAAAAVPLTRPLARRRSRALFELCAGIPRAQALLAVVRLGLPDLLLRAGPLDAAAVAAHLSLSPAAARTLLRAAAASRLLSERRAEGNGEPRYALGPLGVALCDEPGLSAMIAHQSLLAHDLADPVALLRLGGAGTRLNRFWCYAGDGAGGGAGDVASYSALMAATQPAVAREALAAAPFHRFRRVLDLGGGNGAFLATVLRRHRRLRGAVLDLPPVAALAAARFRGAGLADRAEAIGGDLHRSPLPGGFDAMTLNRVLHDHDDPAVLRILRAVRAALPPDGTLLVIEPMAGTDSTGRAIESYFGLYLLAMNSGRPRRPDEYAVLLAAAGFSRRRLLHARLPLIARVMLARP